MGGNGPGVGAMSGSGRFFVRGGNGSVSYTHLAGKIHTDFEKGFIRAEIVPYDTLVELGSMAACKEKGLVRSEGKDYVMQDGDVVLFRFNV